MNTDDIVVNYITSNLYKSIDPSKNHKQQVQYKTKNGKIATRMQWVSNGEAPVSKKQAIYKAPEDTKSRVKALSDKIGNEELLNLAKSKGIEWDEHPLRKINLMRMKMAVAKAIDTGVWDNVPDIEQKRLSYIIKSDDGGGLDEKYDDIHYGLTKGSKSVYEKEHFSEILDNASDESLRNYRTLGMCAGDDKADAYLADLYNKYTVSIRGTYDDNVTKKLTGVVSQGVITCIKNSLKDAKKRVHYENSKYEVLHGWFIPNCSKLYQKEPYTSQTKYCYNKDYRVQKYLLEKLGAFPEYAKDTKEYEGILNDYIDCFNTLHKCHYPLSTACNRVIDKIKSKQLDDTQILTQFDKEFKKIGEDLQKDLAAVNKELQIKPDNSWLRQRLENLEEHIKTYNEIKDNIDTDMVIKSCNSKNLELQLFDKKFDYININLYHTSRVLNMLMNTYSLQRDVIEDWPVLTPDEIDRLDIDHDIQINLAITAATFKPSLQDKDKTPQEILLEKYQERQDLLDTYGGLVKCVNKKYYSEDNEIRCKVSSVDANKFNFLANKISNDWDKTQHGRMKYEILGIYEVSNLEVEQEFNSIVETNKPYQLAVNNSHSQMKDIFYHGTGSMATSLILGHSGQFKVVKAKVGRLMGDGIYLADKSSKSAQYISDISYSRHGTEGTLMVVEASLGKVADFKENGFKQDEADTIAGSKHNSFLRNNEWCVKNPQAVLPKYLVHMKIH